jgi:hypothetical protein
VPPLSPSGDCLGLDAIADADAVRARLLIEVPHATLFALTGWPGRAARGVGALEGDATRPWQGAALPRQDARKSRDPPNLARNPSLGWPASHANAKE